MPFRLGKRWRAVRKSKYWLRRKPSRPRPSPYLATAPHLRPSLLWRLLPGQRPYYCQRYGSPRIVIQYYDPRLGIFAGTDVGGY